MHPVVVSKGKRALSNYTACPIELVGLSNDASQPWGVNASQTPSWTSKDVHPLPVVIGTPTTSSSQSEAIFVQCSSQFSDDAQPYLAAGHGANLAIGPEFNYSTYKSAHQTTAAPGTKLDSVPFGLNLGHAGVWNGSLTFGGTYDANRVQSGHWAHLSDIEYGNNGDFLNTGNLTIGPIRVAAYPSDYPYIWPLYNEWYDNSVPHQQFENVHVDLNSDAIVFPSKYNYCNKNISVFLEDYFTNSWTPQSQLLPIPANLTSSPDRCKVSDTLQENEMILGRPFLQAVVMVVPDTTGDIWVMAAHQLNLPVLPKPFDPTATLVAAHLEDSPSSSSGGPNLGAIIGGSVGGFFGLLLLVSLIVWLIRRRPQKQTDSKGSDRGSVTSAGTGDGIPLETYAPKA